MKKIKKFFIHKNKNKKRGSLDNKINLSGFEKLHFLKAKTKSTHELFLYRNKKKKKKGTKKYHINNNNTSISQQKDSSPSIEKNKKNIKKNTKKINNYLQTTRNKDGKKKTFGFLKTRKTGTILEAIKKIEKRKSTNFNNIVELEAKRKISPVYNEDKKPNISNIGNNKNDNSKKNKFKLKYNLKKINNNENYNDNNIETDIFNIIDEYLYKRKNEIRKKSNYLIID